MLPRNRFAMCLAAVTIGLGVVDSIPAASDPAPPGLIARAESLLVARDLGAESKAGLETLRGRLLAVTDTLETAGVDSLAALTLDRAGVLSYRLGELDEARRLWARGLEVGIWPTHSAFWGGFRRRWRRSSTRPFSIGRPTTPRAEPPTTRS